eukprot:m51a1_g844 putative Protein disulfide-isomerase (306) ;mRNA; r:769679-770789
MRAVVVVLTLAAVCALAAEQAGRVAVLTDADFAERTASGVWLVKFYAPWCGHCKKLAPTWEELAARAHGTQLHVAEVDCTASKTVCKDHGVRGYPTVKLFDAGAVTDFQGRREVKAFIEFAIDKAKSADLSALKEPAAAPKSPEEPIRAESVPVKSVEEAQRLLRARREQQQQQQPQEHRQQEWSGNDVVVLTKSNFDGETREGLWMVMFYAPWCGHCKRLAPTWEELAAAQKVAGKFRVAKVDATAETDLANRFSVSRFPTVLLIRNGQATPYEGERTIAAFTAFVEAHAAAPAAEEVKHHSEV